MQRVTVVITSCDRHDLLERTLKSLLTFNTYGFVSEIIVVEDGFSDPWQICARYGAKLLRTGGRRGQSYAIDLAYDAVRTPYVFHCEDDWEFFRHGFMERSLEILRVDLACVCVWLRAWGDTNGHPLRFRSDDGTYGILSFNYDNVWNGFTWNPSLRRLSDMNKVLPISKEAEETGTPGETILSKKFFDLGYHACILDEGGYVKHIGWNRHA